MIGGAYGIVVANKTDLCSETPPQVPSITYGEAVSTLPETEAVPSTSTSTTNAPEVSVSGGKTLVPRAVSSNEGAIFAKEHGLLYVETSAKEGWGVVDAFEWTAREVLKRHNEEDLSRKVGYCSGLGRKLICRRRQG